MQQINLHQQKLFSLIIAAVTLIFMFLNWWTVVGLETKTGMGFGDFGLLSALGIIGVVAACFMGDKTKPFDKQGKMIALASFGAIVLGAILHAIITSSQGGQQVVQQGFNRYEIDVKSSIGIGTWLALASGLIGLAYVSGILNKLAASAQTTSASHSANPPAAPPPPPINQTPPANR